MYILKVIKVSSAGRTKDTIAPYRKIKKNYLNYITHMIKKTNKQFKPNKLWGSIIKKRKADERIRMGSSDRDFKILFQIIDDPFFTFLLKRNWCYKPP